MQQTSSAGSVPAERAGSPAVMALLRETYAAWSADKAPRLAAALAYYVTFALAPFLIIVVQIVALIMGFGHAAGHHQSARDAILGAVATSAGPQTAATLRTIVDATLSQQGQSLLAGIIAWVVLILAAAGLFGAIQDVLNTIFAVDEKQHGGLLVMLRDRFTAFAMIAGIAFLLIVCLAANALLTSFAPVVERLLPGGVVAIQIFGLLFSLAVTTALVAAIFKWLPDVSLSWRDVLIGAVATAVLFTLGELPLGWYLGRAGTTSVYGAAGSLVAILLWVYYSSQILLLGAEFTKVYAKRRKATVAPPTTL